MPRFLFRFLIHYKYQVIFPIAIIEGPIITLIAGFLVSLGYLGWLPTLILVFLGDMISDSFFYVVGKYGRKYAEKIKFLRLSEERMLRLERHYQNHPGKTIVVTKLSYGLGMILLMAAGASKLGYRKFLEYITPMNAAKSSALLAIGYYFGQAYRARFGVYLEYYTIGVILLLPFVYWAFIKRDKIKAVFAFYN